MGLSIPQMALMSRLLDEALPLDEAARRVWLDALAPEHSDLAPALRQALLPQVAPGAGLQALSTLPKFGALDAASAPAVSGLQSGARVGPYELIRPLGAGGMAEVWLARRADGAFKRELALKLPMLTRLRTDLELRFGRERDILASLEHPHIARLYDAGIDPGGLPYLAMEYVRGQPLTNWCDAHVLGISARLQLFLQVLAAVQYAHEKQVVHRDLKPSNILVTDSGQVRLLDFGIAKLLEADDADRTQLTSVHGRALTPDYASPELLRGDPVDARSDIYSLGVLLYEMLTGGRPYRLKSAGSIGLLDQAIATLEVKKPSTQLGQQAVAARATTKEQLARQLRGDLDAIALKALAREPERRYPSCAALAEDLQRYFDGKPIQALPARFIDRLRKFVLRHQTLAVISTIVIAAILATVGYTLHREAVTAVKVAAPEPAKPNLASSVGAFEPPAHSVAVLPFVDMSENKDQEYFSDGLAAELLDLLAKVPGLVVIARTSSFSFKGKSEDIPTIAKKLNVANILEGSVRKSGDRLRVTTQLVRADTGVHIWSETYDRELKDVFKVQDDIAESVVSALKVSLLKLQLPREASTANDEAYTLYLQSQAIAYSGRSPADSEKARYYLKQTLKLDPSFAPAWAALANNLAGDYSAFGTLQFQETRAEAHAAADQALKLDSLLPLAHVSMGRLLYEIDWDWDASEVEIDRAIALEPGNAEPYRLAAYIKTTRGHFDEALGLLKSAVALDPLQPWNYVATGFATYRIGDLAEAERDYRKALDLNPTGGKLHYLLGSVLLVRGQPSAALDEMARETDDGYRQCGLALAFDALGRKSEADRELAAAESKFAGEKAYWIALIYAARDERERAFTWLDRAFRQRDGGLLWIKGDPLLANLVSDPRYSTFLRKMKLAN
jgi:serine/threonine protein kinase/Tfp pilus assembly protein PilF